MNINTANIPRYNCFPSVGNGACGRPGSLEPHIYELPVLLKPVWQRALGRTNNCNTHLSLKYTNTDSAKHILSNLCIFFIPKNSALSVPLCKPVMFLRHSQLSPQSNPPSQFEACQLWLSNVSEMNRQRPISLPSLFLTPPCNHPLVLISLMTDRLLAAFPVLVGFPLPLSHSSTHFVF